MVSFRSLALVAAAAGSALAAPLAAPSPNTLERRYNHYMDIVGEWRGRMGLSQLNYDGGLESNAMDTVVSSNGQMIHKLNPGSMAQVLAPGSNDLDAFWRAFVGGWLCERPDLPGLNGICDSASQGWEYSSTGHADILTSPAYSRIGCANSAGIWGCDLA